MIIMSHIFKQLILKIFSFTRVILLCDQRYMYPDYKQARQQKRGILGRFPPGPKFLEP